MIPQILAILAFIASEQGARMLGKKLLGKGAAEVGEALAGRVAASKAGGLINQAAGRLPQMIGRRVTADALTRGAVTGGSILGGAVAGTYGSDLLLGTMEPDASMDTQAALQRYLANDPMLLQQMLQGGVV